MQNVAFLPDIKRPEPGPDEAEGLSARVGDLVRWHDPKTKAVWSDLEVELVYQAQAKASVLGFVGKLSGSDEVPEARRVSLLDCIVVKRAGERV